MIPRLSGKPRLKDYLIALVMVGAAFLSRTAIALAHPGIAHFILLFPAVVLAGVFCGTAPAATAAAAGLALTMAGSAGVTIAGSAGVTMTGSAGALAVWPPFTAAQLDVLLFVPACAAILWATHSLRRHAWDAVIAETRLAEVFRQIPGAAAIMEAPTGRLVLHSDQSDAILGHGHKFKHNSSDDLGGYYGLHPDGRPYAPGDYPIVRALTGGAVIRAEALRYRRPNDGSLIDLEVYAGPVRDPDGAIVAAVGMAFDVTDRVTAQRRLADSERDHRALTERLRAAINAATLGLWEFDIATQHFHFDATVAALFGLPPQAIEGRECPRRIEGRECPRRIEDRECPRRIEDRECPRRVDVPRLDIRAMIHPDDRPRIFRAFTEVLDHAGSFGDEFRILTPQGETRWISSHAVMLPDRRILVGVQRDVTARRDREDALRAALDARDLLMREADHRIKNSLQLVTSLLRLQHGKALTPDIKESLSAAIARVDAVAETHLAFQRSPDLRRLDLNRMLEDLCRRLGSLNPAITTRYASTLTQTIDAEHAIPLGLIVNELLTNALRHAFPPDTPGTVTLTAAAADNALDITLADNGKGLPATPQTPGLGSTVITMLARRIGATVRTESTNGTTVTVTLTLPQP
jgi:two-component sensor histidine kinase